MNRSEPKFEAHPFVFQKRRKKYLYRASASDSANCFGTGMRSRLVSFFSERMILSHSSDDLHRDVISDSSTSSAIRDGFRTATNPSEARTDSVKMPPVGRPPEISNRRL